MSSAFRLPFFFHKVNGRSFDDVLEMLFRLHPGLRTKGIEAGMLTGYFTVASGSDPGEEALRVALGLQESIRAAGFDDEVLSSRLTWFIRDYIAVGSILAQGQDGPVCEVYRNSQSEEVSPYVFGVLLSALLRDGLIDGDLSAAATSKRQILLPEHQLLEASRTVKQLIDGSDDYRVTSSSGKAGREELTQLERVLTLVSGP